MSSSQLKWVLAILVVALVLWGVSELTSSRPDDRRTGRVLPTLLDGVDRIVIAKNDETIVLSRIGGSWTVNDYDISTTRLGTLFTALSDSAESEIVANNAGVHARMGVDETGTQFTFFQGVQRVDNVIFGKRGADPATVYARRDGEDVVYRYAGGLAELIDLEVDDWRDPVLVDVLPQTVGRLVVEHGSSGYELIRGPAGWIVAPGLPADSAAVHQVLRQLRPLEAQGFATELQRDSVDLERPDRRLIVMDTAGDTLAVLVFDSTEAGFWVRSNRGPTIYSIPRYLADRVMPPRDSFRPAE